jgi:putative lipoprotein
MNRHKLCLSIGFAIALSAAQAAGAPLDKAQGQQEHNNVRPAAKWQRFDYACENSAKIVVYLHDDSAKVYYQDHLYLMRQTPAADGARYSDGKIVWWSKGENGFLQEEDTAASEGQRIAKNCYRVASPGAALSYSTVSGTLTYLVRMALPAQALVQVQLLDLTRGESAAAPGALVAEEKFALGQRNVPVTFTLKVDSAKIDPKHTYGVNARISLMGQVRFANEEPFKVLTQGNPTKVHMVLLPAGKP